MIFYKRITLYFMSLLSISCTSNGHSNIIQYEINFFEADTIEQARANFSAIGDDNFLLKGKLRPDPFAPEFGSITGCHDKTDRLVGYVADTKISSLASDQTCQIFQAKRIEQFYRVGDFNKIGFVRILNMVDE